MPTQKEFDDLKADRDKWQAEHLKRQQGEDSALQKVKDKDIEHEKHVDGLIDKHRSDIASLELTHSVELKKLATDMAANHAVEITKLKAEHILPIVKAEQERRRKEQAAADQAQLDALTK